LDKHSIYAQMAWTYHLCFHFWDFVICFLVFEENWLFHWQCKKCRVILGIKKLFG
jgi:hypothetical protein